jgi:hypothetical protein
MNQLQRAAVLSAAAAASLFATGSALAQTGTADDDAGAAVVVDSVNVDRELSEFDSTTAFRLRLPEGASCAGDSANDDYRVQTFLVPADTDLSNMKYRSRSPDGNDLYRALRFVDGESSIQVPTDQNGGPGEPGLIVEPALPFTFAHYRESSLPPGRWKLGVACTPASWVVDRYWDVEVQLETAADVVPGGLRITVIDDAGAPVATESGSELPVLPVLVGAALVVGVIAVIIQQSTKPKASTTKEYR